MPPRRLRGSPSDRRPRGFTLVETLVALAIFALVGAAAWQVLDGVIRSDERTEAHYVALRQYNRALALLRQDLEQLVPRPVRGADGLSRPQLLVDNEAALPLELTRAGLANPLGLPRSGLQRVAYAVGLHPDYDNADSPHYRQPGSWLLRYLWPQLDGMTPEEAQVQVLVEGVDALAVTVYTERGEHHAWPPQLPPGARTNDVERARLVEIALTHAQWGELRQRVALP